MKALFAVATFLLALGLAGNDDFKQEKYAEKSLCAQLPKPEFCRDEIK